MDRRGSIEALRDRIRALECLGSAERRPPLSVGVPTIDSHLPDRGLRSGAVHELLGDDDDAARIGFAAIVIGRHDTDPVFWLRSGPAVDGRTLDGLGLDQFGLHPNRIVVSQTRRPNEGLWMLEEASRCRAFVAVIAEGVNPTPIQARRLQLAAESGGTCVLLLPPPLSQPPPSLATTRWRIASVPGRPARGGLGPPRWATTLLRCRGGAPGEWLLEWDDETFRLDLVDDMANRPVAQAMLG